MSRLGDLYFPSYTPRPPPLSYFLFFFFTCFLMLTFFFSKDFKSYTHAAQRHTVCFRRL